MKGRYHFLPVLIAFAGFFNFVQAQPSTNETGNARITGIVKDSTNNAVVEFANVALINPTTGKPVNGAVCDEKGKFVITKVSQGTYIIQISFIGFETRTIPNFKVGDKREYELGAVTLSPSVKLLNEVVVEGQKAVIEEKVDRTVYNAENDATAKGGDATDVLKRVPLLSVDLDGNVSLRGSSNIQVLINNKPSTIVASSVADALKQIPADQIKTVEVITSPSAKYDAEGSGGIINIITKKNTLEGLTLNIDAGIGLRGSNLGLNGNYRKKKMGFSLGGFGRSNYNINGDFENNQTFDNGRTTIQRGDNRSNGLFGNYTLGWDYDINKKNSLAASVRYGLRNNNSYQDDLRSITQLNGATLSNSLSNNKTVDQSGTIDLNLTYTHLYDKPQRELSVLGSYSRNDRNNNFISSILNETTSEILSRFRNDNDGLNEEYTFQLDYQTPIGNNQMLETGVKDIRRNVISDFATARSTGSGEFIYIDNPTSNNQLNYKQDVKSAYLAYTLSLKKSWSFKTGARYEYTTITAFSRTEADINIPEYGVLVPSFNASKRLKDGKTIKASYNRRIQRPSIQFLNPNKQISNNPLFQTIGEPTLDPEFTNNYELGYSTFVKGTSLNITGFYRNSDNAIQSLRSKSIYGGDTIVTRYANIGSERAYGSSVFANVSVGKLTLSGGGDIFYAMLDNNVPNLDERASNEGWVPSARMFGGYSFEKGWGLQFFGFYRGRRVLLQGIQGGFGIYSLAVRKDFANKKGSFGLGIENFFAKSITIRNETKTNTIDQSGFTTQNNISFRFNISYRIGKMGFDNQPRRRRSVNNDDLKEGEGGGNDGGGMMPGGGGQNQQRGGGGAPVGVRPATTTTTAPAAPSNPAAVVVAEGTWTYAIESPQGGDGSMVIKKEGNTYTGTITSNRNKRETALKSVILKGNELTVSYEVSFGGNTAEIMMKGIITDNKFEGTMSFGQFGSFPIKATRN